MGRYEILEDVAIADCALELQGADLPDLFATAARALAEVMVDPATLPTTLERTVALAAPALDLLLFDWLAELIFLKDRDRAVFPRADVRVEEGPSPSLAATLRGGAIDPARTALRADPKAVTLHQLVVERAGGGWRARVVLDI